MYHSAFYPTYMFYDQTLHSLNPISSNYISEKKQQEEEPLLEPDDFTSEYLYETELLHAFNMTTYNSETLDKYIQELYNKIVEMRETNASAKKFLEYAYITSNKTVFTDNEQSGFMILFSYHLFHITHICLCELFSENNISEQNFTFLLNNINNLD
jgi:hypothetical protein